MNNEKFRKSLDEIKPSQALINKTIMNIKEKKKINYFMPFYTASLTAVCLIILVTTYIINEDAPTTNIVNDNFLIEIKGEYTFEHIFDFEILPEDKFNNIYVLKYENKIEDNDYTIPYKYYVDIIETMKPLKDNKINTLKVFNEENYDKIVINNEKYFYIPKKGYDMVYYDSINKVYYQIQTNNQEEIISKLKKYIEMFSRMRSIENFIEQTNIKEIEQTSYKGMYVVEKIKNTGEWESYIKTRKYDDYQELMGYIERFRYNKVTKTIDEFDVSKYYGNMLIQFEGINMYIPETINEKILLYVSGSENPIYYEIELQQKDYNTLESIKELIKKHLKKDENNNEIKSTEPTNNTPIVEKNKVSAYSTDTAYARIYIKDGDDLYIKYKKKNIERDYKHDTSLINEDQEYLIESHIKSYTTNNPKPNEAPKLAYVTNDGKLMILDLRKAVETGKTNVGYEIKLDFKAQKVQLKNNDNYKLKLFVYSETGESIQLDF